MNTQHKHTKFQGHPDLIRWDINPCVAFLISGYDLSLMQNSVDFDAESDSIIEKIKSSPEQKPKYAFEYQNNLGFQEVDADEQTWFKFK